MPVDLILGTAGHIDHGKSALVKALTGVNTDRLPEEKRRGITIDLGFAWLTLPRSWSTLAYSCSSSHVRTPSRTVRTCSGPCRNRALAIIVTSAPASRSLIASSAVRTPVVAASEHETWP